MRLMSPRSKRAVPGEGKFDFDLGHVDRQVDRRLERHVTSPEDPVKHVVPLDLPDDVLDT